MLPIHVKSSSDTADATRDIPNRENDEPMLAKLRRDIDDPKCKKSSTEILAPSRHMLRRDKEEPRCRKSNTDSVLPTRAKLRTDRDDPSIRKSNTDTDEP